MPDKRKHRGSHPEDEQLFKGTKVLKQLKEAAEDYTWLLDRGYAHKSSLTLVGDHYQLQTRQREALSRITFSTEVSSARQSKEIPPSEVAGKVVRVDLFNTLITVESMLSGSLLLHSSDNTIKDLASVHGNYRTVDETEDALILIGKALDELSPNQIHLYLDAPVSNSGKLASKARELAREHGWEWKVEVIDHVDQVLKESGDIIVTTDSNIIDNSPTWLNLNRNILSKIKDEHWIINNIP